MFSDLLLVFATYISFVLLGKYSIFLVVILIGTLIYLCTRNCLLESIQNLYVEIKKSRFNYLNLFAFKVGNIFCRMICFFRWSHVFFQTKKLLRFIKVFTDVKSSLPINNQVLKQEELAKTSQNCEGYQHVDPEIKIIVNCIINNYIKWWYSDTISKNDQFVTEVKSILYDTLSALCNKISHIEKRQFCYKVVQLYLHFFYHFKEAVNEVDCKNDLLEICTSKKKEIAQNFKMRHWAMKDKVNEQFYLQTIMTTLVDSFGPVEFLSCPILHSFVIEILTCTVLCSLVNTLSDPDRLNSWVLKLAQNVFKEESEPLIDINDKHNETDFSSEDNVLNDSISYNTPIILLSKDNTLIQYSENTNISESIDELNECVNSFEEFPKSPELLQRRCYSNSETSECSISNISQISGQIECASQNQCFEKQFLYPPIRAKTVSSEDLCGKLLTFCDIPANDDFSFLEIARMKRSKSADSIMIHLPNLTSLDKTNDYIKFHISENRNYMQLSSRRLHTIEMAEEAKELPPFYSDLKIIDTVQYEDVGHSPYTLYCIQYDGVFRDSSSSEFPKLVKRVVNIKRRFREFLALQSRLENNPVLKRYLKNIKGPGIWEKMPFAHLQKKNVAERKPFLEKYLQDLCDQIHLSRSIELQEFLAYRGDASIAFVKKPVDITVPRIDKMIVKGVKGAFDLLRTALPSPNNNAEVFGPANEMISDESDIVPYDEIYLDDQIYITNNICASSPILQEIQNKISTFDDNFSFDNGSQISKRCVKKMFYHNFGIDGKHNCDCKQIASFEEKNIALGDVIIDFIFESFHTLPGPNTTSHVQLLKFFYGSFLNDYMEEKLGEISEEKCSIFLHSLHKALWPDDSSKPKTNKISNLAAILANYTIKKGKDVSKQTWYGQFLHKIVGPDEISSAIKLLIGSFQNESLNKCFLFYALDILSQILCPNNI